MKKNNVETYRGFQKLEENISKIIKPISKQKKDNFTILNNLIKNWPEIIGEKYYQYCLPKKVKISPLKKITLVINAHNSAVAFYLEGNCSQILEKIAAYFGYKIIHEIRITQELREITVKEKENENNKKNLELNLEQQKLIIKNTANINDVELKNILQQLGKNILTTLDRK